MKKNLLLMLVGVALFAMSASVVAEQAAQTEVTVLNAGFEDLFPGVGDHQPVEKDDGTLNVTGWTTVGHGSTRFAGGNWSPGNNGQPADEHGYGDEPPEGISVAYVRTKTLNWDGTPLDEEDVGIIQVLSETLAVGDIYELSVEVGNNKYWDPFTGYKVQLVVMVPDGDPNGIMIAEDHGSMDESVIPDDKFGTSVVSYVYDAADSALLGYNLGIRLSCSTKDVEINYDDVKLLKGPRPTRYPSPANGTIIVHSVPYTQDLSWTNRDPNCPDVPIGSDVWVDVFFSKDPNMVVGVTKIVDKALNGTTASCTPTDLDTTYYWQVHTYVEGTSTGDPNSGPVFNFILPADGVPVVDAGSDMLTWFGESVTLAGSFVDDGATATTVKWTAFPDVVSFDDDESLTPTVTVSETGGVAIYIENANFEATVLEDGDYGTVPGWENITSYDVGSLNPDEGSYASGEADGMGGKNVAYVATRKSNDIPGISQKLAATLQADTEYTLTASVFNPYTFNGVSVNYRIELLAGCAIVAEASGTIVDENEVAVSLVHETNAADPNVGQPLKIRLIAADIGAHNKEVHFDNIRLVVDDPAAASPNVAVTLQLACADATSTGLDIMELNVAGTDACSAVVLGLGIMSPVADFDGDCDVDPDDLAEILLEWLEPSDLATDPVKY